LSGICKLFGSRGTNAIVTKGTGGPKRGALALVRNLLGGRKAQHRQLSPTAKVYLDPLAAILQFLQIGGPREQDFQNYELLMDQTPAYMMQTEVRG